MSNSTQISMEKKKRKEREKGKKENGGVWW
jgi:hypothetical protein